MLKQEFSDRTGFYPSADMYAIIENKYLENVKYKYSFDGQKYEESVMQPIRDIKLGDMKEIRICKSDPKKIIQIEIDRVIITDIAIGLGIFAFIFMAYVLLI